MRDSEHQQRRSSSRSSDFWFSNPLSGSRNREDESHGAGVFQAAVGGTSWTIFDQHRLVAFDRLRSRTLEYHNNVHRRTGAKYLFTSSSKISECTAEVVRVIKLFSNDSAGKNHIEHVTGQQLREVLDGIKQQQQDQRVVEAATPVQWIHLLDLSTLPIVLEKFKIPPHVANYFMDLRFHSCFQPMEDALLITTCYFQMNSAGVGAGSYGVSICKNFCYISIEGLAITFTAELMPESIGTERDGHGNSDVANPLNHGTGIDGLGKQQSSPLLNHQQTVRLRCDVLYYDTVDRLFSSHHHKQEQCSGAETTGSSSAEIGAFAVLYELLSVALAQQDGVVEFFSRTLFHFKQAATFRLPYRKKVMFMRHMHIVNTAIRMVHINAETVLHVVEELLQVVEQRQHTRHRSRLVDTPRIARNGRRRNNRDQPASDFDESQEQAHLNIHHNLGASCLVPEELLGFSQLAYLYELRNSFAFLDSCLHSEIEDATTIANAVDMISQMRADNTALALSLIATIFLPATFLTGVFGMNFQEDGGYTISLVNDKRGPYVFYAICVLLLLVNVLYFVSMGWLEPLEVVRYFLSAFYDARTIHRWFDGEDTLPAAIVSPLKIDDGRVAAETASSGASMVDVGGEAPDDSNRPSLVMTNLTDTDPSQISQQNRSSIWSASETKIKYEPRQRLKTKSRAVQEAEEEEMRREAEASIRRSFVVDSYLFRDIHSQNDPRLPSEAESSATPNKFEMKS